MRRIQGRTNSENVKSAPINSLEAIGFDNVLFETDFPHPTCLFPEPLRSAVPTFKHTPESMRRKVFSENAAQVYNLDLDILP